MIYVIMGCLAFVFLFIFDINKIKTKITILNSMFALGASFLFYASIMLIISTPQDFEVSSWGVVLFSILSLISGLFMFYALFGALPFKKTYVQVNHNQVIDSGVYALCRHPGVWGFFFMYLFRISRLRPMDCFNCMCSMDNHGYSSCLDSRCLFLS
jgi:protein-S-isoprenylcysteine O-methyltransferase Ste14